MLDLDVRFTVSSVLLKKNDATFSAAGFTHLEEILNIEIIEPVIVGDIITAQIFYSGAPRIAPAPPWDVGFVWDTTPGGDPWLGVACEDEGADIWWPCKDHPSDEPDSMNLSFTVPNPLMCISNGQFLGSEDNGDNTSTFHWFISCPINNYNVTFYAAEYMLIEDEYESNIGNNIPFKFWVLPESYNTAVNYMDVFLQEFNFLEEICGPFPFGTDKHGWAHAPYWGMEHQTIIAYGHNFTTNQYGYDYIHYHELAHEWWGNLITAGNWADVWIHEGIATYTEALYVEHLSGMDAYIQFMISHRPGNYNATYPLAPREEMTASQAFTYLNPYNRGASVMHTLRYHLGDEAFFDLLKRWAYPDPEDPDNTNGRQCRILTTDDLKDQSEEVTGIELDPFFEVFFREASYPVLHVVRELDETQFSWDTETGILLDVNIPVLVNGEEFTVEMVDGQGNLAIALEDVLMIDPNKWILMAPPSITVSVNEFNSDQIEISLEQNYPNPFAKSTIIRYSIVKPQWVSLKVFDSLGNKVLTLFDEKKAPGEYVVELDSGFLTNGSYFYRLDAENGSVTKKLIVAE
jgi:aminopeptidase N